MSTREMEKREMILAKTLVCGFSIRFHRHRWYLVSSSYVCPDYLVSGIKLIGLSRLSGIWFQAHRYVHMSRLLTNRLTVHKDLRQSIPQPPQRRQPVSFSLPVNMKVQTYWIGCTGKAHCISKGRFADTSLIVCSLRPLYLGSQQAWTSFTVNIVWKRWLLIVFLYGKCNMKCTSVLENRQIPIPFPEFDEP